MSVDEDIQLPAQPTAGGLIQHIPLGGDGFAAPRGAYVCQSVELTGDASGGNARIRFKMDQVYCSLVAYTAFTIIQGTPANVHFRNRIATLETDQSDIVAEQVEGGLQTFIAANITSLGESVNHTWTPTPVILPGDSAEGIVDSQWANVDGDVYNLSALIYLFDVRVRSEFPMGPLLWSRGST